MAGPCNHARAFSTFCNQGRADRFHYPRAHGCTACARIVRGPARRPAFARGRSRRRHDAAREARLEARSRSARSPRGPAPARRRARLRHEWQDHDDRHRELDPRVGVPARVEQLGRQPRLGRHLDAPRGGRCGARIARGRRVRPSGDDAPHAPACRLPRKPVPRPARPVRRTRAHRRAMARRGRGASARDDAGGERRRPARRHARRRAANGVILFGVDDPRRARPVLQHASDSKYCVRCGHPYRYDAAYVGAPRRVPLRNVRPRPAGARRRRPRDRARRPRRCLLRAARAGRQRACPSRGARALQRLQRACRCVARVVAR